jgi:CDP-diacylglycerol---glycerol-3-phosphate 3-phosphatidyltransferase
MDINTSTLLTLFRLISSPLVLPFLIVYTTPLQNFYIDSFVAAIFLLLSFTDFLDGYLARKYKEVTAIGAMLDPIADKFLSYVAFISLVAAGKLYFYWAIILIGREFFIMSLRMAALQHNFSIPVMFLGKIKTLLQTLYIAILIMQPYHLIRNKYLWDVGVHGMLCVVIAISLGSAYIYTRNFMAVYSAMLNKDEKVSL